MQHTPGPWHIEGSLNVRGELLAYRPLSLRSQSANPNFPGTGHQLAVIWNSSSDGSNLANARLIAAAPDMLEALKEAGIRLEASESLSDNSFARQIKSIIASAEGKA